MKTKFCTFLLLFIVSYAFAQRNYNVFENRSPLIKRLEFKTNGMQLELSDKGIAYVQKDLKNNSEVIAILVKKLHNEMVGGSSELSVDCIASQVYYHVCFYDLNKPSNSKDPNRKLLSKVNEYIPESKIKKFITKFSNDSANPMEISYIELTLNSCKKGKMYTVPPNIYSILN